MKRRIGSFILAVLMVLSLVPMTAVEVKAAATQAEGADFISRSDGVWLFPLSKSCYNSFSDWAGCPGAGKCSFHGVAHSGWGDTAHTNDYKGHNGFDIGASTGTPVYAAADGTAYAEYNSARGNYVIIEHPIGDGWSYFSYYQHLNSCSISDGTTVNAGDVIGTVGSTGYSSGSHLHFGIILGHNRSYSEIGTMEGKGWVTTDGLQEGRILVNPALNSPAGFPTGSSEVVPPLKAHAGSVMYTFDKNEVRIGNGPAVEECEEFYPSWVEVEITSNSAYVKSLPCSKDTNSASADIEHPAVGTRYTTSGLCLNSEGNYWYQVTASTGETGYVYSGDISNPPSVIHRPFVSGEILPETIKGATWLGGEVINGGCKIQSLTAYVYTGNEILKDALVFSSDVDVVNTTGNYTLYQSVLDKSLPFDTLNDGYYTIAIEVHYSNYFYSGKSLECRDGYIVVGSDHFVYGSPTACSHSNYNRVVTEPTCTEGGYTTYICTNCGYSYVSDETAVTGHTYDGSYEWIVERTCTQDGIFRMVCVDCGYCLDQEIEAMGHDYTYELRAEPSFDEVGVVWAVCTRCDYNKTQVYLPVFNIQDYDYTVIQEPTCTDNGVGRYTWKVTDYGTHSFDAEIPAIGHRYGYTLNVVPTADRNGSVIGKCSGCDDSHVVYLPVLNAQDYDVIYILEPTCTEKGAGEYTWKVTDYGTHSFLAEIPALGHRYGYTLDVRPTVDQNGSVVGKCSRCGDSHVVSLPILNTQDYDYTIVQEPSYTQEGIGRYTWKNTDYGEFYFDVPLEKLTEEVTAVTLWLMPSKLVYEIGEELDPTGLKLQVTYNSGRRATVNAGDAGLEISGFDSAAAGEKTVVVTYAGYSVSFEVTVAESEEPDPTPEPVDPDAPQIVVSGGRARAGETLEVTVAVKNNPGIASMKLKVAFDPALTLTGVVYNTTVGGQFTQPQSMNSPVVLNWVSAFADVEGDWTFATLTFTVAEDAQAGAYPVTVTYDPDDLYDMTETNIEFAVQPGVIEIVEYIPGDINGDGKVNNKDATRLLQYLSEWDVEVVEAALDVNGDGKVNNKDATRLLQYLSEWDVEIH